MFGLTPYHRKGNRVAHRNDPFDFKNVFDSFFNDSFFPSLGMLDHQAIRADIKEYEKEYVIEAEIPGVNKEDIQLDLRDDTLTIAVEHREDIKEEKENYIRRERRYDASSRRFYVENIKAEDVSAKYDQGILTITLPKSDEPVKKGHRIDIH